MKCGTKVVPTVHLSSTYLHKGDAEQNVVVSDLMDQKVV